MKDLLRFRYSPATFQAQSWCPPPKTTTSIECLLHMPHFAFAVSTVESTAKTRNSGKSWGMCSKHCTTLCCAQGIHDIWAQSMGRGDNLNWHNLRYNARPQTDNSARQLCPLCPDMHELHRTHNFLFILMVFAWPALDGVRQSVRERLLNLQVSIGL